MCSNKKKTIFFLLKVEKNKRKSYDFITSKLNEELEGERKEKRMKKWVKSCCESEDNEINNKRK